MEISDQVQQLETTTDAAVLAAQEAEAAANAAVSAAARAQEIAQQQATQQAAEIVASVVGGVQETKEKTEWNELRIANLETEIQTIKTAVETLVAVTAQASPLPIQQPEPNPPSPGADGLPEAKPAPEEIKRPVVKASKNRRL